MSNPMNKGLVAFCPCPAVEATGEAPMDRSLKTVSVDPMTAADGVECGDRGRINEFTD